MGDLGPSSTPVVCGPRGATFENPIPPLAFWPKPISLFGLPRYNDAYRRSPGLTLSPDPSPHPASRLPGRNRSHDFLLSPSWRFGTLSEGLRTAMDAPWKHALVGYPRRNAGSGHCYCDILNNRARQAITRHRVATNRGHVRCAKHIRTMPLLCYGFSMSPATASLDSLRMFLWNLEHVRPQGPSRIVLHEDNESAFLYRCSVTSPGLLTCSLR